MSTNECTGLGESLWETFIHTYSKDSLIELLEVGFDALLKDGIARDIPVIGTLVALCGGVLSIRDWLFTKKLARFLVALDSVPHEERQAQLDRLASNPKERKRVGEHLILLIDRLNDMDKPELLARAFSALLDGRIDRQQFDGLAHAIDAILPQYCQAFEAHMLKKSIGWQHSSDDTKTHLMLCGLLAIFIDESDPMRRTEGTIVRSPPASYYKTSQLGRLFYEVILKDRVGES